MKKVLITGVSSGIGYDACKFLINKGYFVFGSVRKERDLERLSKEFGTSYKGLLFNVTEQPGIDKAYDIVSAQLGSEGLTALINNAGIAVPGPLYYLKMEDLEKQLDVNLKGVFRITNKFLPLLGFSENHVHPPGKIINISSVSGIFNSPFNGPYCISKHALESLSDVYRRELIQFGIDVITIEPGPVQTPIWEKAKDENLAEQYSDTLYKPIIDKVDTIIRKSQNRAIPVEEVSKLIYKILRKKRPKVRYLLHKSPWMIRFIIHFIPDRWVDKLIMKTLMKDAIRPF